MPKIILRQTEEDKSLILEFNANNSLLEFAIDIGVDQAGTYTTNTLTNVATLTYEINGTPTSLPFTLVDGDVLNHIITRTTGGVDSTVKTETA